MVPSVTAPSSRVSHDACYLIVWIGDHGTPVIANGPTHFAVQTRRQELADDAALRCARGPCR